MFLLDFSSAYNPSIHPAKTLSCLLLAVAYQAEHPLTILGGGEGRVPASWRDRYDDGSKMAEAEEVAVTEAIKKGLKSMKALALTLVLLAIAVAVSGSAPAAGDEITFAQVAKATKIYFRDSAEFPMRMNVEMTISDQSGRVRKHKTGKVDYDFHGYNSRSGSANAHFRGPRPVMKAALGIIASSFVPMSVLFGDAEKNYSFTLAPSPEFVIARLVPMQPCEPATWADVGYVPEGLCGSLSLHLNKDDIELQRFTFDEAGLPILAKVDSLGPVAIQTYHAEAEFQKAFLPDDPKPFLVPKLVTVTITTDKGKLVISSAYAPDPARRK